MERERGAAALWGHGHLPLLARARSKDSVEYILQALWRTRRTGLDAADRAVTRDILQLSDDADLDPVRDSPPCHSPPLCDAVQLVVNPD
jgi:COMM domain containing 9